MAVLNRWHFRQITERAHLVGINRGPRPALAETVRPKPELGPTGGPAASKRGGRRPSGRRGPRASAPSSGGRPPQLDAARGESRRRTRRSARSVRGWGRAASGFERRRGQSSRVPSMAIVGPSPVMFLRTAAESRPLGTNGSSRVSDTLKHHGGWGLDPAVKCVVGCQ